MNYSSRTFCGTVIGGHIDNYVLCIDSHHPCTHLHTSIPLLHTVACWNEADSQNCMRTKKATGLHTPHINGCTVHRYSFLPLVLPSPTLAILSCCRKQAVVEHIPSSSSIVTSAVFCCISTRTFWEERRREKDSAPSTITSSFTCPTLPHTVVVSAWKVSSVIVGLKSNPAVYVYVCVYWGWGGCCISFNSPNLSLPHHPPPPSLLTYCCAILCGEAHRDWYL